MATHVTIGQSVPDAFPDAFKLQPSILYWGRRAGSIAKDGTLVIAGHRASTNKRANSGGTGRAARRKSRTYRNPKLNRLARQQTWKQQKQEAKSGRGKSKELRA